jgi:hypothetical protein
MEKKFLIVAYDNEKLGHSDDYNPSVICRLGGTDEKSVITNLSKKDVEKIYSYYMEVLSDCDSIPDELSVYFDSLEKLQKMKNEEIINTIQETCKKYPEKFIESMERSWNSPYLTSFVLFDTNNVLYRAFKNTNFIFDNENNNEDDKDDGDDNGEESE